MGASVEATCPCGFSSGTIPIGGGMHTFRELCLFPVFCRSCKQGGVVNLFEGRVGKAAKTADAETAQCKNCGSTDIIPYDEPELVARKGAVVESWGAEEVLGRVLVLTDGEYFCPKCKQFKLTFKSVPLMWD